MSSSGREDQHQPQVSRRHRGCGGADGSDEDGYLETPQRFIFLYAVDVHQDVLVKRPRVS